MIGPLLLEQIRKQTVHRHLRQHHHLLRLSDRVRQAIGQVQIPLFQGAPVSFEGQHFVNLALAVMMLGFCIIFVMTQAWLPFILITIIALILHQEVERNVLPRNRYTTYIDLSSG